jgi:poly(A) polymerase
MNDGTAIIDARTRDVLEQAAHYFAEQQRAAWLVGGAVRNLLLGETETDWDIVTTGNAASLARRLADRLGGYYAYLHEKASRVVLKQAAGELILDIAPLQGETIEADLRMRDFTINAVALPLGRLVEALKSFTVPEMSAYIDPLRGRADAQVRLLRAVDSAIFRHDPLRLLRAIRFKMRYQLTIEPRTEMWMRRDAALLLDAAPERIHDELYAILAPAGATERLRYLDTLGLFTTLIPEFMEARGMPQPTLHYWDVFDHSIETVAALELLATTLRRSPEELHRSPLETPNGDLVALQKLLLDAEQQGLFSRRMLSAPVMKLAALLHDIGKPPTYTVDDDGIHFYGHPQAGVPLALQVMQRIHASTQDKRLVQQVVANHMRPGQLSHDTVTPRAVRRYFLDLGPTGIAVALVSLADHIAMRGPLPLLSVWERHLATVRLLLSRYIHERESIVPPRLVQPDELMHRFNLQPGPLIGRLLELIAESQADGTIHSRTEALWLVEEYLKHDKS